MSHINHSMNPSRDEVDSRQGVFSFMRPQVFHPFAALEDYNEPWIADFPEDRANGPISFPNALKGLSVAPEHREHETYPTDPVFDHSPDTFMPAPENLTTLQQIEFQDLYKLSGRVIGRHDAVVDMPWFFTAQYLSRSLACTVEEAKQLSDYWQTIQVTEEMVRVLIDEVKSVGIQDSLKLYQEFADAMKSLEPDHHDALEHQNDEGFAHNYPNFGSNDFNPEWRMLLHEGVPSAACIAGRLSCSLEEAGDLRELIILQALEAAQTYVEEHQINIDEEDLLDNIDSEVEDTDDDIRGFISEGWHLFDDKSDPPDEIWPWFDAQPAQVKVLIHQAEHAERLSDLKKLGQKAYHLTTSWTSGQRGTFWAVWKARRLALLSFNMNHMARVRKAVVKIQKSDLTKIPSIGKRLFQFSKKNPDFYPEEGWAVIWGAYRQAKAKSRQPERLGAPIPKSRRQLVAEFLDEKLSDEEFIFGHHHRSIEPLPYP